MGLQVGENIRKVRELKGYTQDFMASKLGISQKAYSNIETNKTQLDTDRLVEIAEVLEINPTNLIAFDEKLLFNNCNHSGVFNFNTIHNTASEREVTLYEKHIKQLEQENAFLRKEIEFLRSKFGSDSSDS